MSAFTSRRDFSALKQALDNLRLESSEQPQRTDQDCIICKLSPSAATARPWRERRYSIGLASYVDLSQTQLDTVCPPCYVRRAATLEYLKHLPDGESPTVVHHQELGISLNTTSAKYPDISHVLELSCDPGGQVPPDAVIDLRPMVLGDTSNERTFRWIQDRLRTCNEQHPNCGTCGPRQIQHMPKHLLDISCIDIQMPERSKLRIVRATQDARYVCLSYCWGTPSPNTLNLNKDNSQVFFTIGISWGTLPQAFQDATILLAKLGYLYVWIDALCIVQDDPEQKAEEIQRMGLIYSHSDLVVANLHATSPQQGLFHSSETKRAKGHAIAEFSRGSNIVTVRRMLLHPKYSIHTVAFHLARGKEEQMTYSPLMSRAWTLQELLLAPRILYFSKWEALWECGGSMTCQCESPLFSEHAFAGMGTITSGTKRPKSFLIKRILRIPRPHTEILNFWAIIVKAYARRRLTHEEDRHPAICGIASEVARQLEDDFVAGVFRNSLNFCLSWFIHHEDNLQSSPGGVTGWPSWTWLSVVGVEGADINNVILEASKFHAQTDTMIRADMCSGRHVLRASAFLILLPLTYVARSNGVDLALWEEFFFASGEEPSAGTNHHDFRWDSLVVSALPGDLYCIELGAEADNGNCNVATTFLVLQPKDDTDKEFIRRGIMTTWTADRWQRSEIGIESFNVGRQDFLIV